MEKNTSEKGDGAPGRGGRLHLPPFGGWKFNKEVKEQVGGVRLVDVGGKRIRRRGQQGKGLACSGTARPVWWKRVSKGKVWGRSRRASRAVEMTLTP